MVYLLQIEHHPHLVQTDLITYCKEKGIHFQAYSSLGTTTAENQVNSQSPITIINVNTVIYGVIVVVIVWQLDL
jgi:diketogulonate reductase-like aldo/keto reductase